MPDPSFNTTNLQVLLAQLRSGDLAARDQLVRASQDRLLALVRRMLRKFPVVNRWADGEDVFQGAVMRLLRALEQVEVHQTREFLNLAATQIRRELIDLARHFQGPQGIGANHDSIAGPQGRVPDHSTPTENQIELDLWVELHQAVEGLPAELRETFGLRFYHRWTETQISELFQVDERTVRRRWRAACTALNDSLQGYVPKMEEDA